MPYTTSYTSLYVKKLNSAALNYLCEKKSVKISRIRKISVLFHSTKQINN